MKNQSLLEEGNATHCLDKMDRWAWASTLVGLATLVVSAWVLGDTAPRAEQINGCKNKFNDTTAETSAGCSTLYNPYYVVCVGLVLGLSISLILGLKSYKKQNPQFCTGHRRIFSIRQESVNRRLPTTTLTEIPRL